MERPLMLAATLTPPRAVQRSVLRQGGWNDLAYKYLTHGATEVKNRWTNSHVLTLFFDML